jgi:hypothetical protein
VGERSLHTREVAGSSPAVPISAVFVMAEDAKADEIATNIRRLSNLKQYDGRIQIGEFSADAQKLVKEQAAA